MISIVDAETLQNVLRPTVYVPFGERNDQPPGSRESVGGSANRMQPLDESASMARPETLRARIR
jgi:hypothetical protein